MTDNGEPKPDRRTPIIVALIAAAAAIVVALIGLVPLLIHGCNGDPPGGAEFRIESLKASRKLTHMSLQVDVNGETHHYPAKHKRAAFEEGMSGGVYPLPEGVEDCTVSIEIVGIFEEIRSEFIPDVSPGTFTREVELKARQPIRIKMDSLPQEETVIFRRVIGGVQPSPVEYEIELRYRAD